jgi:hypothetical protein
MRKPLGPDARALTLDRHPSGFVANGARTEFLEILGRPAESVPNRVEEAIAVAWPHQHLNPRKHAQGAGGDETLPFVHDRYPACPVTTGLDQCGDRSPRTRARWPLQRRASNRKNCRTASPVAPGHLPVDLEHSLTDHGGHLARRPEHDLQRSVRPQPMVRILTYFDEY